MRKIKKYQQPNIFRSFYYALRGLGFVFYTQKNMRIHLFMACVALGLGIFFQISKLEWISLIFSILFVLFAETINTALEINVDLTTKKIKFRAMLSKDLAAGAVLISAINAIIIGCFIFGPRFF